MFWTVTAEMMTYDKQCPSATEDSTAMADVLKDKFMEKFNH